MQVGLRRVACQFAVPLVPSQEAHRQASSHAKTGTGPTHTHTLNLTALWLQALQGSCVFVYVWEHHFSPFSWITRDKCKSEDVKDCNFSKMPLEHYILHIHPGVVFLIQYFHRSVTLRGAVCWKLKAEGEKKETREVFTLIICSATV